MELFPFQKTGVEWLKSRRTALLADEQGLGKTVQAIVAADRLLARSMLVVCPAGVKLNWDREISQWFTRRITRQIVMKRSDLLVGAGVTIINYDLLSDPKILSQIMKLKFAVGVFDEAHYLKTRGTKRTAAVLKAGAASRCVYKWFLTGTPVLNRPVELYPILKSTAPEVIAPYDTYDEFTRRFCNAFFDGFQMVVKGSSNEADLAARLTSRDNPSHQPFMLRRLKKDVLKELPDKIYQILAIPAKSADIRKAIEKELTWSHEDAKHQVFSQEGGEIARLRHALALSKLDAAAEHLENLLLESQKIVVFAYHRDVIQQLAGRLVGYNPVVITGETPAVQRQRNVDAFQSDPQIRLFIGQIQAAGTGLTLTASSNVVFVESSWVPGEIDQATDRCHRIGQKESVLVQFLVLADSLEEHQLRIVIDKKRTIKKIVGS